MRNADKKRIQSKSLEKGDSCLIMIKKDRHRFLSEMEINPPENTLDERLCATCFNMNGEREMSLWFLLSIETALLKTFIAALATSLHESEAFIHK